MHYVIPVNRSDYLRHALRSLDRYHPEAEVTIIGYLPEYINPRKVNHVITTQLKKFSKAWNLIPAVEYATTLSEPFIWGDDDIIYFDRMPDFLPAYGRLKSIDRFVKTLKLNPKDERHTHYVEMCRAQALILGSMGVSGDAYWGETHYPLYVDPKRFKPLIRKVCKDYPSHPIGAFEAIYNTEHLIPVTDCKLLKATDVVPAYVWCVGLSPESWAGYAGKFIREEFNEPSRFER